MHPTARGWWPDGLYTYEAVAMRESDGSILVLGDSDRERLGEDRFFKTQARFFDDPGYCGLALFDRTSPRGLWAATKEVRSRRVYMDHNGSREIEPDYLAAFVRHLISADEAPDGADLLPAGRAADARIIWSGYGHNALAVLLAATLITSTAMQLHSAVAGRRYRRRLSAGLCPRCKYPLLERENRLCPECGWREDDRSAT